MHRWPLEADPMSGWVALLCHGELVMIRQIRWPPASGAPASVSPWARVHAFPALPCSLSPLPRGAPRRRRCSDPPLAGLAAPFVFNPSVIWQHWFPSSCRHYREGDRVRPPNWVAGPAQCDTRPTWHSPLHPAHGPPHPSPMP